MIRLFRLLLLCLILPAAGWAQEGAAGDRGYDGLMDALAHAETEAEADGLVPQIWKIWLTAPDATAQEMLDAALTRRQSYDFLGALRHLDRLVTEYPDYAEGWNQRATVYFMTGNFEKSLADVDEVLAREPRHFGALAGRAMIYFQQGRLPLAQIAVRRALRHHPFLSERSILDIPSGDDI